MSAIRVKEELLHYAKLTMERKLVVGPGGNLSARYEQTMYVTPSGLAFDELTLQDLVGVDISSGKIVEGERRPTSEVLMHLFCYRRRQDITAVVHAHPPYTIAFVSSKSDIRPMFPDFVVYLGKEVPVIDYITPTTEELAREVEQAIQDANGVVLVNHGALTVGANLKEAFYRTEVLEEGIRIQLLARLAGNPRFIHAKEAEDILNLGSEKYRQQILRAMQK